MFNDNEKYNGLIPQIKYLPTHAIFHSGMAGEVHHVSDDVAHNMDFSEPVEATAFRYGKNNDEALPEVQLSNGHHRLAAAKQIGKPHLPVVVHAINAKGSKLNALKTLSDEIESRIHKDDGGGITAYHGSPHEFEQFDTSKIGTGEGAQAFGHGLYFASDKNVADDYRIGLSNKEGQESLLGGKPLNEHYAKLEREAGRLHPSKASGHYEKMSVLENMMMHEHPESILSRSDDLSLSPETRQWLQKQVIPNYKQQGHMYEVHIDAHPDHFLDWDKPLSEQSGHVQRILKNLGVTDPNEQGGVSYTQLGKQYGIHNENGDFAPLSKNYAEAVNMAGGDRSRVKKLNAVNPEMQSQILSEAGIHGIRYLDAGSRGGTDQPTHNYVVFDHDRVNIKRRYADGGEVEAYGEGGGVDRTKMSYKDVTQRVPELKEAAPKLGTDEMTPEMYQDLVNKHKPVQAWDHVPAPATQEEIYNALDANKRRNVGKGHLIPEGYPVGLRLDIPAYTNHGVWVPTIHDRAGSKPTVLAHEPAAHITNAEFNMSPNKALKVAQGGVKNPFATIDGSWNPTHPDDIHAMAQQYLNHPDWAQVGMDPERHSYFYDRRTQQPITHASEVLQVGPLVLAHKPVYGNKEDYPFKDGGVIAKHPAKPHNPAIVEYALNKISAPPPALDPTLMVAKRGRPF